MLQAVKMSQFHWHNRKSSRIASTYCGIFLAALGLTMSSASAQTSVQATPASPAETQHAPAAAPVPITLEEAIKRAEVNEPTYAAAMADNKIARLDRSIARAGLLPSATFHNQYLYTQPNGASTQTGQGTGSQPAPIFIANNAVHEYASQGVFDENLGLAQVSDLKRANAAAALAAAELEIARRGLVSAVTSLYFGLVAADNKLAVAETARAEAVDFTRLTEQRERAREAAHADSVKALLQQQQRERELSDAKLAAQKARLELGVLLFPDPRTPYTVSVEQNIAPLASRGDVVQAAA